MKIKKIEGENFKGHENLELNLADKKIQVFVGKNGVGKSSAIEMIQYAITGVAPLEPINNKYNYQSNRSYILNRIKCNIVFLLITSANACGKKIFQIVSEASKILSVVRSDRKFGRYRKHTRRRYYNHMKSCI